jgi:hypothetical protein
MSEFHTHVDEKGVLHRCYHKCRSLWYVWAPLIFVFQVLMFPLEHKAAEWAWEQPGLSAIAEYLHLDEDHE